MVLWQATPTSGSALFYFETLSIDKGGLGFQPEFLGRLSFISAIASLGGVVYSYTCIIYTRARAYTHTHTHKYTHIHAYIHMCIRTPTPAPVATPSLAPLLPASCWADAFAGGQVLYDQYLKQVPLRTIFKWTTLTGVALGFTPLALVTHANRLVPLAH